MPRDRADVVAALTSKGFVPDNKKGRDHDWYFFKYPDLIRSIGTYVSRGTDCRELSDRLLGKMSRQLQLTRPQFDSLVDCSMDEPKYVAVLRSLGVLRLPPV